MSAIIEIANCQRVRPLSEKRLIASLREFLDAHLPRANHYLAINLVNKSRMARINQTFLNHAGPTDIITFDYSEPNDHGRISGELFVCVPVAVEQAKLFHSSWQSEILRYITHGVLHLMGFDDQHKKDQARMKREENRLLALLERQPGISACFRDRTPASLSPKSNTLKVPR